MSLTDQEVRALVLEAADALNRQDLEAFVELMHPEVEFKSLIAEAEGETYRGHEGVRRWWESVRGAFEEATWDYREIHVRGDRGIAKIRIHGTMAGVAVDQTMWQLFTVRDGKPGGWEFFRTEPEARAAAGMSD